MQGIFVSEQELIAVMSHYNLSSRKDWLKNAMRAKWNRDQMIVLEDDEVYEHVERSGLGIKVEVRRPA
ncbi:MAG: hypothetical protein WC941_09575 [Candidatus Bathyarchaeia archaeon]